MIEVQEPINVWVFFKENLIQPHTFFWHGRQLKIDQVNLIHTSKDGSHIFYHFSVSSGGNFYRLKFDPSKMSWILEAIDDDNTAY